MHTDARIEKRYKSKNVDLKVLCNVKLWCGVREKAPMTGAPASGARPAYRAGAGSGRPGIARVSNVIQALTTPDYQQSPTIVNGAACVRVTTSARRPGLYIYIYIFDPRHLSSRWSVTPIFPAQQRSCPHHCTGQAVK